MEDKILNESLYSLDKVVIEFEIRPDTTQNIMMDLAINSNVEKSWECLQALKYRYNYTLKTTCENSYYIGVHFNTFENKQEPYEKFKLEFNPNKVMFDKAFIEIYSRLHNECQGMYTCKKIDLAIDIPVARENCELQKDQRKYSEIQNSLSDRTQYLGSRGSHGRVKVYNKQIESKLDFPLTRLEITLKWNMRSIEEVGKIFPTLRVIDNIQYSVDHLKINGTDKVLFLACLDNPAYIKMLGRKMRKKIESMIELCTCTYELDSKKYSNFLAFSQKVIENKYL